MAGKQTSFAGSETAKVNLRLPEGLRERVAEMAAVAGRSMNSEFVIAMQAHVDGSHRHSPSPRTSTASEAVDRLTSEIASLRNEAETTRERLDHANEVLRARAGALRFYEHSIRVNALAVLASGVELPAALSAMLREWAAYEGMVSDNPPPKV